jgi:hypothetical protein
MSYPSVRYNSKLIKHFLWIFRAPCSICEVLFVFGVYFNVKKNIVFFFKKVPLVLTKNNQCLPQITISWKMRTVPSTAGKMVNPGEWKNWVSITWINKHNEWSNHNSNWFTKATISKVNHNFAYIKAISTSHSTEASGRT